MSDEIRKLHLAHKNMLLRCYNPNSPSFKHYGQRGVTVCDEWRNSRSAFVNWAIKSGHRLELTLDRIDVNGNYEPNNCRWVSLKDQLRNQRRNRRITIDGKTKILTEWAEDIGILPTTLSKRLGRMSELRATGAVALREWRHGTRQGYEVHKCKCDECRSANALRHRTRRAAKKNKRDAAL